MIFYLPLALLLIIFFVCANAILLPFGYVYGVFTLLTQKSQKQCARKFEWMFFLILGPVFLVICFISYDLIFFIRSLCCRGNDTPKANEMKIDPILFSKIFSAATD
jgi:hypothetical protein